MLARDLQLTPMPWEYLASASQGPPSYSQALGVTLVGLARDLHLTPGPWEYLSTSASQGHTPHPSSSSSYHYFFSYNLNHKKQEATNSSSMLAVIVSTPFSMLHSLLSSAQLILVDTLLL